MTYGAGVEGQVNQVAQTLGELPWASLPHPVRAAVLMALPPWRMQTAGVN